MKYGLLIKNYFVQLCAFFVSLCGTKSYFTTKLLNVHTKEVQRQSTSKLRFLVKFQ